MVRVTTVVALPMSATDSAKKSWKDTAGRFTEFGPLTGSESLLYKPGVYFST